MNNLSTLEKEIVNFIVEADTISDGENTLETHGGPSQRNAATIEALIPRLLRHDQSLHGFGLVIDFDETYQRYTVHVEELNIKDTDARDADDHILSLSFPRGWSAFEKMTYLLVRTTSFLDQLEADGYLDKVPVRNTFENQKTRCPYSLTHAPGANSGSSRTFEIKSREIVDQVLASFAFAYVPNYKLRDFWENGYKTVETILSDKEFQIARSNLRIARVGLYTAVISAIASLVAIVLTLYSLGVPATVRINEDQMSDLMTALEGKRTK